MGDYESRIFDVQSDINSLIERINRCDPSLCNEDWHGMTYGYDMTILQFVYQHIDAEEMLDIITDLICKEHRTLVLEGKIKPYIDNVSGYPDYEEPQRTLEYYAEQRRELLSARRDEQEARELYTKKLMERKQEAWKRTQDVPIPYFPDGTPDVEEYEGRLADEVEDVLRENETLLRRIGDRDAEIKRLKQERINLFQNNPNIEKEPEKAFNAQTGLTCFTSRQMGILLTAVGRITEKETPPGKTTIGDIVEKIAGYRSTTASSNMRGEIPQKDTETVAKAIESKFPNLAAEVRKV
jgi:hypothetical protein